MDKNKTTDQGPGLAPGLAAQFLASRLGDTADLWLYRLANWRRPGRRAVLRASETPSGHPTYLVSDLEQFVEDELSRRVLVSGPEGWNTRAGAMPKIDGPERPHVRVTFVVGTVSQSVFALDPASARKLAQTLEKSVDLVERALT